MQLVKLNVANEAGLVRVEITADSSFSDVQVEQITRGRETVIRVRGARSLLRPSYEIGDPLARGVRTLAGEGGGEPFVDVVITTGEGATVAQKKVFNRLIIGIASDFARLRRPAPATGGAEVARARSAPRQAVAAAPVTATIPKNSQPPDIKSQAREANAVNVPVNRPNAGLLADSRPQFVFRGRTIWANLPQAEAPSTRPDPSAYALFYQTQQGVLRASSQPAAPPTSTGFLAMTLEAPGATRGVWVPGTTTSVTDEVGGKPFGPGVLRPSVLFGAGYDTDFFYRSATGRKLWVFTLAPRLEYEIPGERNALRLAYEPRIRRLSNGVWANGHLFDVDTRLGLASFAKLSVRDHFVRSPLDPREYDPAGEVYIVGDTFKRNDIGARLDFALNPRSRLGLGASYNDVRWDEDKIAGAPLFINYAEPQFDVTYERDISEEATATATFSYGTTHSSVPLRQQFTGLNNNRRYAIMIGGRTQVAEGSGFAARIGYERDDYYNAPRQNNFRGLVFNLTYRRDLSQKTNFELAGLRKTQVSIFNLEGGNARLLTTGGTARLEHTLGEALKVALGINYQQLGFPLAVVSDSTASGGVLLGGFAGERRKDHLYGFSAESGYRWSEYFRSRLVYNFMRRDSTLPVLTFNRHRLSLVLELGRRNDVRGRPF
jgi:hypothetical protein